MGRAIAAAGGWNRWTSLRDVTFVTTFILYDAVGNVRSESVGLHRSRLHAPPRARFESLGLPEPVVIGFDGARTWMTRSGQEVSGGEQLALARFNMISDVFWFGLAFQLLEIPAEITALEPYEDDKGRWEQLRVRLHDDAHEAPADWFVVGIDERTGRIGRVFLHVTAPFLPHRYWVGRWSGHREWDGIVSERRRQFFPADPEGRIVAGIAAERLVEDVRFDTGVEDADFELPAAARSGLET